jgi:nucleoside-diphosphate-sugar epimerase
MTQLIELLSDFCAKPLAGKQVLVVGGTGFVGSRLVEQLVTECGARVRVLVRNFANAVRIARFPVEMVPGDVTSPAELERAADGCEIVFHCAYGNTGDGAAQRAATVDGTGNVLAAAARAKAARVVYLSTLSVYGRMPDGDLDETAPRSYAGGNYADTKLDAEKVAFEVSRRHDLPLVVLQPTIIYGPYGPLWTVEALRKLKTAGVLLINEGSGLCNAVFIDDVVSAIMLAATRSEAVGEAFLISGAEPVTWREFYGRYERMLGLSNTVSMSAAEAKAYYSRQLKDKRLAGELRRLLREDVATRDRILQTPEAQTLLRTTRRAMPDALWGSLKKRVKGDESIPLPSLAEVGAGGSEPEALHPLDIYLNGAKTRVRIDKARKLLGYRPAFDFEAGMAVTEQWARWANLLDS